MIAIANLRMCMSVPLVPWDGSPLAPTRQQTFLAPAGLAEPSPSAIMEAQRGAKHAEGNVEGSRARRERAHRDRGGQSLLSSRCDPPRVLSQDRYAHGVPVEGDGELLRRR